MVEKGANLDLQDEDGDSALMYACMNNQPEVAKLMVEKGAKIDLQNKDGDSALIFACRNDQPEVAKLLLEKGANLDLQDEDGDSALQCSVCSRECSPVPYVVDGSRGH